MKKIGLASIALLAFAIGTFSIPSTVNANSTTPSSKPSTSSKADSLQAGIPPPTCPPNDPHGCGIYE